MDRNQKNKEGEKTTVHMQEGPAFNYFEALYEVFGGTLGKDSYVVKNATVDIRMDSFRVEPGLELLLTDAWYEKDVVLDREPDGNADYVHIYLVLDGVSNQSFEDRKETVEAGTVKGAFVYNGLFHMQITHPGRKSFRSAGIKIHRETLEALLPEALDLFTEMLSDPEGVAYHASIPAGLEKLCQELFHYRDAAFGRRSMTISRGLEALTAVFDTIRKLRERKELHGLHEDDFDRLQRIKERILSRVEEKVSLETLASEFSISVSKLKRDFRSLFDTSVYQFYTQARMDEAYRRLKSGKYSVMEVGYDLGYQNLSKFSEMFKKVKGMSPSEVI